MQVSADRPDSKEYASSKLQGKSTLSYQTLRSNPTHRNLGHLPSDLVGVSTSCVYN